MVAQLCLQATLETGLDQLLDQPVLAVELNLAGIDHRVQLVKGARGFQRFHTLPLHAAAFLTLKLLINHGHQCLGFQSGAPHLTQTI
jgi:hypothetical protein